MIFRKNQESLASSLIQATGMVEFKDGLLMGVLQEDYWCPYSGCTLLELIWQGLGGRP